MMTMFGLVGDGSAGRSAVAEDAVAKTPVNVTAAIPSGWICSADSSGLSFGGEGGGLRQRSERQ